MPVGRQQEVAFTRVLLVGSLLVSLALGAIAAARGELDALALVLLAAVTAAAWALVAWLGRRGRPVTWLIGLGVLNLVLLVPELALRAVGSSDESGVELQLTEQRSFSKLVRDPELFWKYDPARPEVNSWGFEGPEIEIPKPPGVSRILFLGDSCADLGRPPYPEVVERVLNERRVSGDAGRVESVSLSVVGYTSHQGLAVARRYGAVVEPDVVVLHYGWNDHWLAYGGPDHELAGASALATLADRVYASSRLLQYVHSSLRRSAEPPGEGDPVAGTAPAGEAAAPADLRHLLGSEPSGEVRVPPDRYRRNLLEIAHLFRELHVPVVFVTPPSSHRTLGTPEHFVELSYAVDAESVVDLHRQYSRIVREVARESGERLFDLEAAIDELPPGQLRRVFLFDGIHYAAPGCRFVGRRVADHLESVLAPGRPVGAAEPTAGGPGDG